MIIVWCFYNLTMCLGFFVYWPWAAMKGKRPARFWQRMGHVSEEQLAQLAGHPVLWMHAVSVGEAQAIQPLLRQIKEQYPQWRIALTTVTFTGQHIARTLVGSEDIVTYFPLDLPWAMRRFIARVQPKLFLAVETELWPNCFRALHERGVPIVVVNGRLSPRSFAAYHRVRWFLRSFLSQVELFLMQTPEYAERLQQLGVPSSRIRVVGNLKWDQGAALSVPVGLKQLAQAFGLDDGGQLLVAGSTHPGEEEPVVQAYQRIARDLPHLRCLVAPRHIERTTEVSTRLRKLGLEPITYSQITQNAVPTTLSSAHVVVVDTIGHLRNLYALATVAFVGGSLVPKGGQNPLEPAQFGKPILTGPHLTNFRAVADVLNQAGGLRIVANAAELETALRLLLTSTDACTRMGQKARSVIQANQGAVERTLAAVQPVLAHWARPTTQPHTIWRRGPRWYHWMQELMTDRPGGLLAHCARAALTVLSWAYGAGLAVWDISYRRGWARVHTVDRPVISVGNLTVGGTGKSSCVLWLAEQLRARGMKPAIVTRGYGRDSRRHLGDEPTMFLQALEDVPVLVGWDRVRSAQRAIEQSRADVILLDDGFQHRRLGRRVDLVTVDAMHGWGNARLLPRGPLREPLTALARAHVICLTKTNLVSRAQPELLERLRATHPQLLILRARHEARGLWHATARQDESLEVLRGARVAAVSSIGDPDSFEHLLAQLGATVGIAVRFPDHHRYRVEELRALLRALERSGVRRVVTTAKDWVRLGPLVEQLGTTRCAWSVLKVTLTVDDADAVVDRLLRLSYS